MKAVTKKKWKIIITAMILSSSRNFWYNNDMHRGDLICIVHPWYCSPMVLFTHGIVHPWYCPPMVLSTHGIVHPWYCPPMVLSTHGIVYPWYCPPMVLSTHGIVYPWYCSPMVFSPMVLFTHGIYCYYCELYYHHQQIPAFPDMSYHNAFNSL